MYFGEEVQDCKDGSGLQFIKIDFWTGCQEIKATILVKFESFASYFFFLS